MHVKLPNTLPLLFEICFAFSSPPSSLSLRQHTVQDSWWKAWVLWDYCRGIMKGQGSRPSDKWFFSVSGLTPTGLKNLNKVLRSGVFADKNRTPYKGSEYPNIEWCSNTQELFMFYLFLRPCLFSIIVVCMCALCVQYKCLCCHCMWTRVCVCVCVVSYGISLPNSIYLHYQMKGKALLSVIRYLPTRVNTMGVKCIQCVFRIADRLANWLYPCVGAFSSWLPLSLTVYLLQSFKKYHI